MRSRTGGFLYNARRSLRKTAKVVGGGLRALFLLPWHWARRALVATAKLAQTWWRTRQMRFLLQGLPALAAAIAVLVAIYMVKTANASERVQNYRREARRALDTRDFGKAKLCYERLVQLDRDELDHTFRLGLTCLAMGDKERGATIIATLAPADRQGYRPAHLWQAQNLMPQAPRSPQAMRLTELHLLRSVGAASESDEAHLILGQFCIQVGRNDDAEQHLLKAVRTFPEAAFLLAGIYGAKRDKEKTGLYARQASDFFRTRAEASLDDHAARLNWAEAQLLLGDYQGAVLILMRGLSLAGTDAYRRSLGRAYAAWAASKSTTPDRLVLVEEGLRLDPGNQFLLRALVEATRIEGAEADRARKALQNLLAEGKATAYVHLFLAVDAFQNQKLDQARVHFDQAYRLNPNLPVIANNLAWLLAHTVPPDYDRALELANSAIERSPKELRFRETRGQILMKKGSYQDALADLEAALPALKASKTLFEALAQCYEKLGLEDIAATYRQRVAELKSE